MASGTPLAPLLKEAFWGRDSGDEELRGTKPRQNFACSLSLEDAMDDDILLCCVR